MTLAKAEKTKRAKSFRLSHRQAESLTGFVMAAPWILGFLFFVAGPMIASLYLAMTRWDIFTAPKFLGLENFEVNFPRFACPITAILSANMAWCARDRSCPRS